MEKTLRFGGSQEQMLKMFKELKYEWVEKVEFWENQISNDALGSYFQGCIFKNGWVI